MLPCGALQMPSVSIMPWDQGWNSDFGRCKGMDASLEADGGVELAVAARDGGDGG